VVEKYMLRQLIRISTEAIKRAYEQDDPFSIYNDFLHHFNHINEAKNNTAWITSQQAATRFLNERQQMIDNNGRVGISTTFPKLDNCNAGFRPGNLVLLAARPSVGKSAVAAGIAIETARNSLPVGILNLEMTIEETFGRMVSLDSGIHHSAIERDTRLDEQTLLQHVTGIAQLPIYFSPNIRMNIRDITSAAEYLKRKRDIQLLVIDYLQLIEEDANNKTIREQEVRKISRGLKTLAMSLRIPIIALSQLNRKSDERSDKRPSMSDLRESGALEQDADVIMLLHRDWRSGIVTTPDGRSTEYDADLLVPKWRNGSPCNIKLHFHPQTMKFSQAYE
jgi:replicative DNA helicase